MDKVTELMIVIKQSPELVIPENSLGEFIRDPFLKVTEVD